MARGCRGHRQRQVQEQPVNCPGARDVTASDAVAGANEASAFALSCLNGDASRTKRYDPVDF